MESEDGVKRHKPKVSFMEQPREEGGRGRGLKEEAALGSVSMESEDGVNRHKPKVGPGSVPWGGEGLKEEVALRECFHEERLNQGWPLSRDIRAEEEGHAGERATLAEHCWQESGGFESCVPLGLPSYWFNSHQSHGMLSWCSINLFPIYVASSEKMGAWVHIPF